jgi:aspartate carbamoyltransferase
MNENSFIGRTLHVINDFNESERLYLFEKARELKTAIRKRDSGVMDRYRIDNPDFGLYEVFLEDSTRTRESFKNAALFHHAKALELNVASSSFNKSESYADTFANLIGYDNQIFVVRSTLEGVCKHLAERMGEYLERQGFPEAVSFINAGDGRHEHPTQELLDEFTFLEDLGWDHSHIHLAMVGDLYHGRTVHSKVRGLKLFSDVTVDLVAPTELAMPRAYVQMMRDEGFAVSEFDSIDDYLDSGQIAPQWYFTRPQIERMGERILRRQHELRSAITFREELSDRLPAGAVFYHPLPRHREHPTIPADLDHTPLNGWERQSANGWIVRIVLLSALAGRIGQEYDGPVGPPPVPEVEFVHEVPSRKAGPKQYSEGIRPIEHGVVIDHLNVGETWQEIRAHMNTILNVTGLGGRGGEWISTGSKGEYKGLIFRPDHEPLTESEIKRLAAVAPGSTLNVISGGQVERKIRLSSPNRIYGIDSLICRNEACITHPDNHEPVQPRFTQIAPGIYACDFCDAEHSFKEIWQ